MVNKPLIRPYFWGYVWGGGWLTSHYSEGPFWIHFKFQRNVFCIHISFSWEEPKLKAVIYWMQYGASTFTHAFKPVTVL